ncbi:MAG: hypothetical protein HY532_06510 [Chloroflexi bacterium]|nr:hypothetical protein [Chloroflexota bacterium]
MNTLKCYMLDPQGKRPEKIQTRPRLPQAALHCPPLAEGNQLGWLVYPNTRSSWEVERQPDVIRITHQPGDGSDFPYPFVVTAFEDGSRMAEVLAPSTARLSPQDYDRAPNAADKVFHDLHNPAGAVTLAGNCWFQTPDGWDSVWMGVTNMFDPPMPQAYTVRVQTDWFAGSRAVEVRYQLRMGERLKVNPDTPIGMVVFLPRQDLTPEFLPYPEELKTLRDAQIAEKYQPDNMRGHNQMTPFSVWYLRNKRP